MNLYLSRRAAGAVEAMRALDTNHLRAALAGRLPWRVDGRPLPGRPPWRTAVFARVTVLFAEDGDDRYVAAIVGVDAQDRTLSRVVAASTPWVS